MEAIWNLVDAIDDTVGLAVIRRDFTVERANQAHLNRWPRLVKAGETCYWHVNKFTRPCEWCPVQQSFEDGRMHGELVCSPMGDGIVFSHIVSIPVSAPSGALARAVELVFERTRQEEGSLKTRAVKYKNFSAFGDLLERVSSTAAIPILLLVGALWEKCLGFSRADVLTLDSSKSDVTYSVREIRSLKYTDTVGNVLADFNTSFKQEELEQFRQRVVRDRIVEERQFKKEPLPLLRDMIGELCGAHAQSVRSIDKPPETAIRLAPNTVATGIMAPEEQYLLVVHTLGTGHDIITNPALIDTGIYGSVVERAVKNRKLASQVDTAVENCEDFFRRVENDIGTLVFASSVVSSLAHDLRTSCANVTSNLNDIWARVDPKQKESAQYFYEALKTDIGFIRACMDRAVDTAALDSDDIRYFTWYDIHKLIRDTADSFRVIFAKRRIHCNFAPTKEPSVLFVEPLYLKQVLSNLIQNACDFLEEVTHRKRRLVIRTNRTLSDFSIIVRDNGMGINPAIMDKMWRLFFSTKKVGRGRGLGLEICRRIIEDIHGGQIHAQSRYGFGATFTVVLPIDAKRDPATISKG